MSMNHENGLAAGRRNERQADKREASGAPYHEAHLAAAIGEPVVLPRDPDYYSAANIQTRAIESARRHEKI